VSECRRDLGYYSLDNDITGTRDDSDTLTLDNTGGTLSKESLVRGNCHAENAGVITIEKGECTASDMRLKYHFADLLCD